MEGAGVGRIVDEAKMGDEILNVGLFEETYSTGDLVRDACSGELHLHIECDEMGTIQDCYFSWVLAFVDESSDSSNDELCLLLGVHSLDDVRALAGRFVGPEFFVETGGSTIGDDGVGHR